LIGFGSKKTELGEHASGNERRGLLLPYRPV
jgi:hypothetical protein